MFLINFFHINFETQKHHNNITSRTHNKRILKKVVSLLKTCQLHIGAYNWQERAKPEGMNEKQESLP